MFHNLYWINKHQVSEYKHYSVYQRSNIVIPALDLS